MENTAPRTWPERHRLPDDLAAALRAARLKRGLGLREASRRAGLTHGHFCMIEHGERCPSRAAAEDLIAVVKPDPQVAAWLRAVARPDVGRSARDARWARQGSTSPPERWQP